MCAIMYFYATAVSHHSVACSLHYAVLALSKGQTLTKQVHNAEGGYLEHGAEASNLLLGHASSNDLEGLLLQLVHGSKAAHALQNDIVKRLLAGCTILTHPVMLQDAVGICPLLGILQAGSLDHMCMTLHCSIHQYPTLDRKNFRNFCFLACIS